jgi:hypothetical protein
MPMNGKYIRISNMTVLACKNVSRHSPEETEVNQELVCGHTGRQVGYEAHLSKCHGVAITRCSWRRSVALPETKKNHS